MWLNGSWETQHLARQRGPFEEQCIEEARQCHQDRRGTDPGAPGGAGARDGGRDAQHASGRRGRPAVQCRLKRTWGGEVANVSVLVAIGVGADGYRQILGVCEGARRKRRAGTAFCGTCKSRARGFVTKQLSLFIFQKKAPVEKDLFAPIDRLIYTARTHPETPGDIGGTRPQLLHGPIPCPRKHRRSWAATPLPLHDGSWNCIVSTYSCLRTDHQSMARCSRT